MHTIGDNHWSASLIQTSSIPPFLHGFLISEYLLKKGFEKGKRIQTLLLLSNRCIRSSPTVRRRHILRRADSG
ncbi:hypothetical protein SUGI_0885480 [Cryptomeria japonica]|nr:hypothetical protein SUGI_0885480 [Cryptomeria japonica]